MESPTTGIVPAVKVIGGTSAAIAMSPHTSRFTKHATARPVVLGSIHISKADSMGCQNCCICSSAEDVRGLSSSRHHTRTHLSWHQAGTTRTKGEQTRSTRVALTTRSKRLNAKTEICHHSKTETGHSSLYAALACWFTLASRQWMSRNCSYN
jgi:hypothetical protein